MFVLTLRQNAINLDIESDTIPRIGETVTAVDAVGYVIHGVVENVTHEFDAKIRRIVQVRQT